MDRPARLGMVDDHGIDVVGQAADGWAALKAVGRLAPDVVVMDLNLPRMSGIEAISRMSVDAPATNVLVLTISADEVDVTTAILAGASGYLLKDASIDEIVAG